MIHVAAKTAREPKSKLIPIICEYTSRSLNNKTPARIGIIGYVVWATDTMPIDPNSVPLANRKNAPIFMEDVNSNRPKILRFNFCQGISRLQNEIGMNPKIENIIGK